jgi:hypothetical protein
LNNLTDRKHTTLAGSCSSPLHKRQCSLPSRRRCATLSLAITTRLSIAAMLLWRWRVLLSMLSGLSALVTAWVSTAILIMHMCAVVSWPAVVARRLRTTVSCRAAIASLLSIAARRSVVVLSRMSAEAGLRAVVAVLLLAVTAVALALVLLWGLAVAGLATAVLAGWGRRVAVVAGRSAVAAGLVGCWRRGAGVGSAGRGRGAVAVAVVAGGLVML